MTTIKPLVPPYSPEVQSRFDAVMPPGVEPLLLFRVMAKSERAWSKLLGGSMLDSGPLTLRQREIVIIRSCVLAECEYEWGVHVTFFAKVAGLRVEELLETVNGDARSPCWTPDESVLVLAADALFAKGKLNGAEIDELKLHYDDEQIIEVIQLCGYYRTISYLVRTFDLPLENSCAQFSTRVHPF